MSVPYKKKPARIQDAVRPMWKKPSGGTSGTFGSGGTGHGSTTSNVGNDSTVPLKKKPKRKGRPDGF
jgi:hypothetical protein